MSYMIHMRDPSTARATVMRVGCALDVMAAIEFQKLIIYN